MKCPHCDAEHADDAGRFCDECGLSVIKLVKRDDSAEKTDDVDRCPSCGTPARPPLCPACFTRFSASSE